MGVSHLSGTTSKAGLSLAAGDVPRIWTMFSLICFFTGGSVISGYVIPGNSFKLTRGYGPLFVIGTGIILVCCILESSSPDTNYYFYFAAMACGLQNAMVITS